MKRDIIIDGYLKQATDHAYWVGISVGFALGVAFGLMLGLQLG